MDPNDSPRVDGGRGGTGCHLWAARGLRQMGRNIYHNYTGGPVSRFLRRRVEQALCTAMSAARRPPAQPNPYLLNNNRFYSLTVTLDNGV